MKTYYVNTIEEDAIFSVTIDERDNTVSICEECDNYFARTYSKEEAIALFEEIINWIKENDI